ncbi:hypothetical protein JT358_00825 [Micrococcales bacterium 31B]|nr:hypothetical protein [Micrococcales bacterium 31B]
MTAILATTLGFGAAAGYASVNAGPTNETGAIYLNRNEGANFSGTYRYDCPIPGTTVQTGVCVYGKFSVWNGQAANLEGTQQGYGYIRLGRLASPGGTISAQISKIIYPGDTLWASGLRVKLCRGRPIVADCEEKLFARKIPR